MKSFTLVKKEALGLPILEALQGVTRTPSGSDYLLWTTSQIGRVSASTGAVLGVNNNKQILGGNGAIAAATPIGDELAAVLVKDESVDAQSKTVCVVGLNDTLSSKSRLVSLPEPCGFVSSSAPNHVIAVGSSIHVFNVEKDGTDEDAVDLRLVESTALRSQAATCVRSSPEDNTVVVSTQQQHFILQAGQVRFTTSVAASGAGLKDVALSTPANSKGQTSDRFFIWCLYQDGSVTCDEVSIQTKKSKPIALTFTASVSSAQSPGVSAQATKGLSLAPYTGLIQVGAHSRTLVSVGVSSTGPGVVERYTLEWSSSGCNVVKSDSDSMRNIFLGAKPISLNAAANTKDQMVLLLETRLEIRKLTIRTPLVSSKASIATAQGIVSCPSADLFKARERADARIASLDSSVSALISRVDGETTNSNAVQQFSKNADDLLQELFALESTVFAYQQRELELNAKDLDAATSASGIARGALLRIFRKLIGLQFLLPGLRWDWPKVLLQKAEEHRQASLAFCEFYRQCIGVERLSDMEVMTNFSFTGLAITAVLRALGFENYPTVTEVLDRFATDSGDGIFLVLLYYGLPPNLRTPATIEKYLTESLLESAQKVSLLLSIARLMRLADVDTDRDEKEESGLSLLPTFQVSAFSEAGSMFGFHHHLFATLVDGLCHFRRFDTAFGLHQQLLSMSKIVLGTEGRHSPELERARLKIAFHAQLRGANELLSQLFLGATSSRRALLQLLVLAVISTRNVTLLESLVCADEELDYVLDELHHRQEPLLVIELAIQSKRFEVARRECIDYQPSNEQDAQQKLALLTHINSIVPEETEEPIPKSHSHGRNGTPNGHRSDEPFHTAPFKLNQDLTVASTSTRTASKREKSPQAPHSLSSVAGRGPKVPFIPQLPPKQTRPPGTYFGLELAEAE